MTKIKNTKKGMAKKTLSISLAVAMLATSNVPVWAAEFTDGTDAAFTSEAPVVEEEVIEDARNTDHEALTLTNKTGTTISAIKANGGITVETNYTKEDTDPLIGLNFYEGKGDFVPTVGMSNKEINGGLTELSYKNNFDKGTKVADKLASDKIESGKTYYCVFYECEEALWNNETAEAKQVLTIHVTEDNKEAYYTGDISLPHVEKIGYKLDKDVVSTIKVSHGATVEYVWTDNTGKTYADDYVTKASDKGTTFYLTATIHTDLGDVVLEDYVVIDFINDESITGNVTISNEHNDQWGYEVTAHYDANLPENTSVEYTWQVYNADTKKWEKRGEVDYGKEDGKYVPTRADAGKKLRVLAKFMYEDTKEVIIEKESNEYEVKPLSFNEDEITVAARYVDSTPEDHKANGKVVVDSISIKKEGLSLKGGTFTATTGDSTLVKDVDYKVITQDIDKPGHRTVTIKLIGAFAGEKTKSLEVSEYNLNEADVTLKSKYVEFAGDGQYVIPEIDKVTWAGGLAELKEGEHYEIAKDLVKGNIYAGPQDLWLRGLGQFTGTNKLVPYTISARNLENCKVVWTGKPVIKGEELVPGVDVKDTKGTHFIVVDEKGYILTPEKDYTFTVEGLSDVSQQKCRVKITAKASDNDKDGIFTGGNYHGTINSDYVTVGTNLEENLSKYVAAVVSAQTYTGKEITFDKLNKISVRDLENAGILDGNNPAGFKDDLEVGVDFDITYLNNKDAYTLRDKEGNVLNSDKTGVVNTDKYGVTYYIQEGKLGVDANSQNDDPQAPQVYLTFKGKFSGKTTPVRFAINQAEISTSNINGSVIFDPTVTDSSALKAYAEQIKSLKLVDSNKNTLTDTVDYTYDYYYVNNKDDVSTEAGEFVHTAVAHNSKVMEGNKQITVYDGNYYGRKESSVKISPRSIKADSITVADIENQKYTGKLIEPKVTVKDGSYTLVEDVDYKLSYKNNRSAGTATVIITGTGKYKQNGSVEERYTGYTTKTFVIENKSIADAKILRAGAHRADYTDLSKYTEKDYTLDNVLYNNGREVEPEFTVVDANNNELIRGYDYTVKFENNTKVGTGKIIITGKGDYEGTLEGTFEIIGKGISGHFVEESIPAQTYTGSPIEPKVAFVPGTPNLVEGRDYEIVYEYNVEPGDGTKLPANDVNNKGPKVVARGIGQYAGFVKKGFVIKKSDITVANVTAEDATYAGGKIAESKITVINPAGGAALEEGKDYSVEYVSGTNVGETGKAVLHLLNNKCLTFSGDDSDNATITVTYDIVAKDLKDVTVDTIEDQTATGEELKPTLVVRNGSVVMTEGVDYEVTYKDNKEVGVGSATITPVAGNKNYTGSKEVTFNIVAAKPEVEKAIISEVKVSGNTVTPVLSGDVEGAVGYDYVLATEEDYKNGRVDISKNILNTHTNFYYVPEGTYYVYCHAWKRDAETNKKIFGAWSNIEKVEVTATTPSTPKILKTSVKGNTVTVTYTKSEGATGYDVILGSEVKKVNGEYRPVNFNDLVVKNIKGNVYKATFKNVPEGKYYAGLHSFNRTSEDGKKVFSKWSNRKTVTVR